MARENPASSLAIAIASAIALVGIVVTASLGLWQLNRLEWKRELIDRIETRLKADPVSLGDALSMAAGGENIEYLRVRVEGKPLAAPAFHFFATGEEGLGYELVEPIKTAGGDIVLINRGYVPDSAKDAVKPMSGGPVIGLVRLGQKQAMFAPDNDVAGNLWYWRDLAGMQAQLPAGTGKLAPFILALEAGDAQGWPRAGVTRLDIPNNHLQYVFTWFSFAIILAVIYGIWMRRQMRLKQRAGNVN